MLPGVWHRGGPPKERGVQDRPHASPSTQDPWDPGELVPRVTGGMFAPPSFLGNRHRAPQWPPPPFRPTPGAPRPSPVHPPVPLPRVARLSRNGLGRSRGAPPARGQPAWTVSPENARGTQAALGPSESEAGAALRLCGAPWACRARVQRPHPSPLCRPQAHCGRHVSSTVGHLVSSRTPPGDVAQTLTRVPSPDSGATSGRASSLA